MTLNFSVTSSIDSTGSASLPVSISSVLLGALDEQAQVMLERQAGEQDLPSTVLG